MAAAPLMPSYQFIGTTASDSGELTNWAGPHSDVAFYAPGNEGSVVPVSVFDLGNSIAAVPTDVLNTTSASGSDELDLTSKLSSMAASNTSLYGTTNATVFNWNGSPASPGPGVNDFSLNTTIGILTDSLDASDWGLIKDYELSLNSANAPGIDDISVTNFQDTNIQVIGEGMMVGVSGAQRGDFNMSQATGSSGHVLFALQPVAPVGTTSESTFTYQASHNGDTVEVGPATSTSVATTAYNGTPLLTNGSTSLLDFYDNNGGNTIVLEDVITSNLYLNGGEADLAFITSATVAGWGAATAAAGGDDVQLNPTGSGAANISDSDASGVTLIANFVFGRDSLNMLLNGSGAYKVSDLFLGGNAAVITDPTGERGVVLTGMFASTAALHISTANEGGNIHLLFS